MINLTSGIDMSSDTIERLAAIHRPEFLSIRDDRVEYARGFPNMMLSLWSFITLHRFIPTQKEFLNYFLRTHSEFIAAFNLEAVKARVLRTYPSLMRDLHFYSLTKESGVFKNVLYDAQKDTGEGVDLVVELGKQEYNVCCYVATRRSEEFRAKKLNRRGLAPNTVELALDLDGGRDVRGWKFFDTIHVHTLQTAILNQALQVHGERPSDLMV